MSKGSGPSDKTSAEGLEEESSGVDDSTGDEKEKDPSSNEDAGTTHQDEVVNTTLNPSPMEGVEPTAGPSWGTWNS